MEIQEIKVGSKVKINIDHLELIGFNGLNPEDNDSGSDHASYIINNPDKVYEVVDIAESAPASPFVLGDNFLEETSFSEKELISVE